MLLPDAAERAPGETLAVVAADDTPAGAIVASAGDERGLYGAVVIGALTLAVPISAIREVVPRPRALLPFPAGRDDIIGAIDLRGALVPVLDPVPLLGVPDPGESAVILILRGGDRVLGVAIDAIAGVLSLDATDLTLLHASGDPRGCATVMHAAFVRGETRGMVLDSAALMALDGMPLSIERTSTQKKNASIINGVPTLLFSVGAVRLGLAAHVIEASVPEQAIEPSPVADELWIGLLPHNGRRGPVIDTRRRRQLGSSRRGPRTAAVIVRLPGGARVGLQIDAVNDMRRITIEDIKPLQQFSVGNAGLFAGLYGTDEPSLLLAPDAVQDDPRLAVIGALCEQARASSDLEHDERAALRSFLLVRLAERRLAIPLDQVEEIIATRTSGIGLADHDQGITDFVIHRGRGVPLVSLHLALGFSRSIASAAFTVLASVDGNQAGFMVDELCAVERSAVQRLRDAGTDRAMGRIAETIKTPEGACSVIDLHALIRTLCAAAAPV